MDDTLVGGKFHGLLFRQICLVGPVGVISQAVLTEGVQHEHRALALSPDSSPCFVACTFPLPDLQGLQCLLESRFHLNLAWVAPASLTSQGLPWHGSAGEAHTTPVCIALAVCVYVSLAVRRF